MKGRIVWLAGVLLVVLGSAAWLRGRMSSEEAATAPDRSKVARSEPIPAPARAPRREPNGEVPKMTPPTPVAAAPEPRRDSPDYALIDRLFTQPGPDATEAERLAWEQSAISGYIYPAGHPCEGLPTDTASVRALVDAVANGTSLDNMPEVDRPQILLEGHKKSYPLNNACALNREDPESVESFISCFNSLPEDPRGRPATIWLPVSADHPGATTLRQHFTRLIENRAAQLMAGPRCSR